VRLAALGFVALLATGCMGERVTGVDLSEPGPTALVIEISPGKGEGLTKVWTLICPDRGSLPHPKEACERLGGIEKPFNPVPKDVACTQVYGGPQKAEVHGRFRNHRVLALFTRSNGCEIARWNRLRFLFPGT